MGKSQSLILEQAMLFAVAFAIFVACVGIFSAYQQHFTRTTSADQLDQVKEFVVSNIVKLAERENETNTSVILSIPEKISDGFYEISLSDNGLTITDMLTGVSRFSPVYDLMRYMNFSGTVISGSGRLIIYKKGNKIIIA